MRNFLQRLERLEGGPQVESLCRDCRREGFTEMPYEHCDGKCEERHRQLAAATAERFRELELEPFCGPPSTEDVALIENMRAWVDAEQARKREAWAAKRAQA